MGNLVYKFGLLAPIENAELVRQTMRKAHQYRNTLIEIERGRRAALRAMYAEDTETAALTQAVKDADAKLETALKEIKAARAKTKSRSDTAEMREAVQVARVLKSDAMRALKTRRFALAEMRKIIQSEKVATPEDVINERATELAKNARAYCGVYWGTYLLVEAAMEATKKMPLYDGEQPNDPRFVRWYGEGRVGVQVQKGMLAQDVFGEDRRVRVQKTAPEAWAHRGYAPDKEKSAKNPKSALRLRVSSEGREPVWATWPMILSRPFPPGCRIKGVVVHLRMIGPREEWSVTFSLETVDVELALQANTVALNFGWRKIENELRVATWVDSLGRRGELRLSERDIGALTKPNSLRAIRDKSFDLYRMKLAAWLEASTGGPPAWFTKALEFLPKWKSSDRLARLIVDWRAKRFLGDEQIFLSMEGWRRQDKHLLLWESSQREGSIRRRREIYRVFAAQLGREYGTVALDETDYSELARHQAPETETPENATALSNRQLAAVAKLRESLLNVFARPGHAIVRTKETNVTRSCHACAHVDTWNAAEKIEHSCPACGVTWDQDVNAALNTLARAALPPEGDAPKAKAGSRWDRVQKLSAERKERTSGGGSEEPKAELEEEASEDEAAE